MQKNSYIRNKILFVLLYVIISATGAAGLIYQVTWQKYVSRLLGADTIATAIILATFLGGLSVGYYLCGRFSTRISNHFKAYALLEGIIGVWGLSFPVIFRVVNALTRSWSFAPPAMILVQGVFCSAVLMGIPTICMGGTLPFLTRGLSKNLGEATSVHARIYSINTAGAFLGTLLAGFYLIPNYGLPATMMGTAFLNVGAGLFFLGFATVISPEQSPEPRTEQLRPPEAGTPVDALRLPPWVLYGIAFLSGFYVMTLENVFIRFTNLSLGSSSYSFSLIVAVFVLSIALGSSVVSQLRQIHRHVLFVNQLLITLFLLGVYLSLDTWPYWAHVIRIGFQSNIVGFWEYYSVVLLVLLGVLVLPIGCMGATVPLAFHELKRNLKTVGRHSGSLFSWNTAGNLAGSLIGGIVFYYFFNNASIYLIAVLLAAVSAVVIGWYVSKKCFLASLGLIFLIFLSALVTPFYQQTHFMYGTFRLRTPLAYSLAGPGTFFKEFQAGNTLKFYKDGPTCTTTVVEFPRHPVYKQVPTVIVINGKSDSSTIGDIYTLKLSAHLPALLANARKNIMVIGLGTGVTAGELTLYPDVERIDVAEISPSVIEALPYFQAFNYNVQHDPRVRIHLGDAFRILARSQQKWDIIISEPSNPWVTGVDLLFTREFYKLVKERLTENGILVQWAQIYATSPEMLGMILNTIHQEFSQCRVFMTNRTDVLIVASNRPFSSRDLQRAAETFEGNHSVKTSLATIDFTSFEALLLRELWTPSYISENFVSFDIQSMDDPRLHYIAGKNFFIGEFLPDNYFLNSASMLFLDEYLMVQHHPNWVNFPFTKETFASLLLSVRDKGAETWFPMAPFLELKAYLTDPELFSISWEKQGAFQTALIPFITNPQYRADAWSEIGLANASLRQKISILLQHIQRFRNWVVPYPIDGLKALLQEGISNSPDAYERGWCTLQLALLLLREGADREQVRTMLEQATQNTRGEIILMEQDLPQLELLQQLMNKEPVK